MFCVSPKCLRMRDRIPRDKRKAPGRLVEGASVYG